MADYARRYGPVYYSMLKDTKPEAWDDASIAKVERECRETMPHEKHAEREAWRDRRLMALIAHKREASK